MVGIDAVERTAEVVEAARGCHREGLVGDALLLLAEQLAELDALQRHHSLLPEVAHEIGRLDESGRARYVVTLRARITGRGLCITGHNLDDLRALPNPRPVRTGEHLVDLRTGSTITIRSFGLACSPGLPAHARRPPAIEFLITEELADTAVPGALLCDPSAP